jgi:hypothetical protein
MIYSNDAVEMKGCAGPANLDQTCVNCKYRSKEEDKLCSKCLVLQNWEPTLPKLSDYILERLSNEGHITVEGGHVVVKGDMVKIALPVANTTWTNAVFNIVIHLTSNLSNDGQFAYVDWFLTYEERNNFIVISNIEKALSPYFTLQ